MLCLPYDLFSLAQQLDVQPHPASSTAPVSEFAEWTRTTGRGIFAFACEQGAVDSHGTTTDTLKAFDLRVRPRISTHAVLTCLSAMCRPADVTTDVFVDRLLSQQRHPGEPSNQNMEARAFAALHFNHWGLPASPDQIQVFSGGTGTVLESFLAAVMDPTEDDQYLIAPAGLELSCRSGPASVVLVDTFDEDVLDEWLGRWVGENERTVLYLPHVNRLTGEVLTQQQATPSLQRFSGATSFGRNAPRSSWPTNPRSAVATGQRPHLPARSPP